MASSSSAATASDNTAARAAKRRYFERHLGGPVLSNQVKYSPLHRRPDRHNVPYAQAHDRIVIAYSPLAKGLLGGGYDVDHLPTGPARTMDPLCLRENVERAMPVILTLRRIAGSHDAMPSQVAPAWLIHPPNVVAIPGASSVDEGGAGTNRGSKPPRARAGSRVDATSRTLEHRNQCLQLSAEPHRPVAWR